METKFAKGISYLFHPLLMPLYGTLLVFYINLDSYFIIPISLKLFVISMILNSTFFMPVLGSMLMLRNGYVKSLTLTEKEERRIPFLLTAVFYLLNFYILNKFEVMSSLKFFLLGSCVAIVASVIVSFFWKISVHMIGIGGIVGVLVGLSFRLGLDLYYLIIPAVLVTGIIGFARLKLNAHSPAQVYVGFLLGLFSELGLFLTLH